MSEIYQAIREMARGLEVVLRPQFESKRVNDSIMVFTMVLMPELEQKSYKAE